MANAERIARGEIEERMPVIGSDGCPIGMVDRVEGRFLKLARNEEGRGQHHWLPLTEIAGLDGGMVRLSMPAGQVKENWLDERQVAQRLALDPEAGAGFGRPDDGQPHGSRGHAHGGPKGKREHGQSGSDAPGAPGQTSFGVDRRM